MSVAEGRLPITILVQGGIASGKSTIARLIAARADGQFVDADKVAHEVLAEPEVLAALRAEFGAGVFDPGGRIDRKALGAIVFRDADALARLEALVHPRVVARIRALLEAARRPDGEPRAVVVIDAAVADKMKIADTDLTVFVDVSPETRRRRAVELRGWAPGELERREARQAPLAPKARAADYVVPNDGDLAEAESHVERIWTQHVDPRR